MTANLTVPTDVLACQQPGVPLVAAIVEGELTRNAVHCLDCNTTIESRSRHDYRTCGCPNGTMVDGGLDYQRWGAVRPGRVSDRSQHGPPAWLVALRDARCGTCGGEGHLEGRNIASWDGCFACDATGRLLHDVQVECDNGTHGGVVIVDPCTCGLCFGTGYRTVRCLVDVVKVWRDYTDHGSPAVVVMCEPMVSAGRVFWVAADGSSSVALAPAHVDALAAACGKPPADWPGGYAVIVTTTDQEAE